jgi:hypothetical protein
MPNKLLSAAIKEAYALAPTDKYILETLEFSHSGITTTYICKDRKDNICTIEDLSTPTFEGVSFAFRLPTNDDTGIKELQLTLDNTDQRISDMVEAVEGSTEPLVVKYREYLSDDLTTPQTVPPLELELRGVSLQGTTASFVCSFTDLTNKKFLSQQYTRDRFPTLGN